MSKPLPPFEQMTDEQKIAMLRVINQIIRDTEPKWTPKHDDPRAVFDPVVPAGTQQLIDFLAQRKRR